MRWANHGPAATPATPVGTSLCTGCNPWRCAVRGHLAEGGGDLVANGAFSVHRVWWLLRCSLLCGPRVCCSVPFCVLQCALLGLIPPPCAGRPCSQLVGCACASQVFW